MHRQLPIRALQIDADMAALIEDIGDLRRLDTRRAQRRRQAAGIGEVGIAGAGVEQLAEQALTILREEN